MISLVRASRFGKINSPSLRAARGARKQPQKIFRLFNDRENRPLCRDEYPPPPPRAVREIIFYFGLEGTRLHSNGLISKGRIAIVIELSVVVSTEIVKVFGLCLADRRQRIALAFQAVEPSGISKPLAVFPPINKICRVNTFMIIIFRFLPFFLYFLFSALIQSRFIQL